MRQSREEKERKKQRLSSQNQAEAIDKKAEVRGKPESESKREAPEERLWERKPGRMKGNKQKAEYLETEGKHGKLGGTEVEKQGSQKAERQHLKKQL